MLTLVSYSLYMVRYLYIYHNKIDKIMRKLLSLLVSGILMSVNVNAQEVAPDFEVTDIHGNTIDCMIIYVKESMLLLIFWYLVWAMSGSRT